MFLKELLTLSFNIALNKYFPTKLEGKECSSLNPELKSLEKAVKGAANLKM